MTDAWYALVESNTVGTGRTFCAVARTRGLRPVLLTADPSRYPYVAEDGIDTLILDTQDPAALLDACRALPGLAGVYSSSEYYVAAATAVAAKLCLPAADATALADCRSKPIQRALLRKAGVRVPEFRHVGAVADAVRAADEIGHPVVLKPVSGSGSVGVRLCREKSEVEHWAGTLLASGTNERGMPVAREILVEQYVDGPEFSVETLDTDVVAIVAKHLAPQPFFVESGHDFPAVHADAALADTARRALAALGLGWGAAHTEIRQSDHGPVVIEVNPRLAGGMIPELVKVATGHDLVDAVVAKTTGGLPRQPGRGAGCASIRFLLARSTGTVHAVRGLDEARGSAGVHLVHVAARPMHEVRIENSFRDRLGFVVATGPDPGTTKQRAETAAARIHIDIG